jgi:copper chaperone CopZ
MMPDTPRAFVGRATFALVGMASSRCAQAIVDEILRLPGVLQAAADAGRGTLTVTVAHPVDRGDIAAAVERTGHRLLNV